ncbi:MAG: diguanylate cyclase [Armatimonadota bacterium]
MAEKVLLIENNEEYLKKAKDFLEKDGYEVLETDIREAFLNLGKESPDIIVLNLKDEQEEAFEFCGKVKSERFFSLIPIIVYTDNNDLDTKIRFLKIGVDDFLVRPFELKELSIRVGSVIDRFRQSRDSNPLTGLPGNISIADEIRERIAKGGKFAVCYLDLDNFKAYNDRYGYEKGDDIIKFMASIVNNVLDKNGSRQDFFGHIGGDDFILVTEPEKMEKLSLEIIDEFEKDIMSYYNKEDRDNGYITVRNRRGQIQLFPIMTISIGIAHNDKRDLYNPIQVSEIATELKEYAKTKRGSNIAIDRRAT